MLDIEDLRWAIMKAYPGDDWVADCDGMSALEVTRTYQRCVELGRIKKVSE